MKGVGMEMGGHCFLIFWILETFGTRAVFGVWNLTELDKASLESSVVLVMVITGVGFGIG